MNILRAIPLPLRIAAMVLLVIVLMKVLGSVPSVIFILLAVLFWVLAIATWAYDQGWLNPLARVPGLSAVLGRLANRAAVSGPAPAGGAQAANAAASPGELDDVERRKLHAAAQERLSRLYGNEDAKAYIHQRIVGPAQETPDNPFGSSAAAGIVLIGGPPGVGKTTMAHSLANLLTGAGALRTAKIVTVRPTDRRTSDFSSEIEHARSTARSARGGVLLIDDADWLLATDSYDASVMPGVDFGTSLVETVAEHPQEITIICTLSLDALEKLRTNPQHSRWLGKLARREILLDDLEDTALADVLDAELETAGWAFDDPQTERAAERMLAALRDRATPHFDNAIACRRAAELLIDIVKEEFPELARERTINREAVAVADKEIE